MVFSLVSDTLILQTKHNNKLDSVAHCDHRITQDPGHALKKRLLDVVITIGKKALAMVRSTATQKAYKSMAGGQALGQGSSQLGWCVGTAIIILTRQQILNTSKHSFSQVILLPRWLLQAVSQLSMQ